LWADNKAIAVVLGGLLGKSDMRDCPTPETKLVLWAFTMYTLFRLWGLEIDPSDLGITHPPTAMRFELALQGAYLEVLAKFPSSAAHFWDAIREGIGEAEKGIRYSGGDRFSPESMKVLRDPAVEAHYNALKAHFQNNMVAEMKQYSLVELGAPIAPLSPPAPQLQTTP
jgi:hypothetical protein